MRGTSNTTGGALSGIDHLKQSIRDILTTPLGSRVMRRDYGSRIFELLDSPLNSSTITDIYAATAEAIAKWEPRFQLTKVTADTKEGGLVYLNLDGVYLPDGKQVSIEGIEVK